MRHYRVGSSSGDHSPNRDGLGYSKPIIFVMTNSHESVNLSLIAAWCRSNKFKMIALFLVALLVVQYLFGASIYNIRIFDYNIAQIYIWNDAKGTNQAGSRPVVSTVDLGGNSTSSATTPTSSFTNGTTPKVDSITTAKVTNPTTPEAVTTVSQKPVLANGSNSTTENVSLPLCPLLPPVLVGPIRVWFDYPSYEELEKLYPDLEPGGHGKPKECISRHKVAIIIPYRDRDTHLRGFLHNMHSLLRKQQLDYTIFAVEQVANQTFNRAKLMNVGFKEAMKLYDWQCAIFHDVDLLPEDDRNIYSCPEQPRHMSVAIDKFSYRLPYNDIFGGISALTTEQFQTLNGFSNDYWGWGGEDDDMASRVKLHKYQITRYPAQIARYKMIKHVLDKENPVNACRYNLMYKVNQRWKTDGLSSVNYKVLSLDRKHLYTRILVDLLETESRKRLEDEKVCAAKKG